MRVPYEGAVLPTHSQGKTKWRNPIGYRVRQEWGLCEVASISYSGRDTAPGDWLGTYEDLTRVRWHAYYLGNNQAELRQEKGQT